MAQDPVYLNVFWEGTANTLNPPTTQISLFAQACAAIDISDGLPSQLDGPFKIAFDGCGVTNGISGTLFASGLRGQAASVKEHVETIIKRGRKVVLNVYGLSRGGIAAIYLCQAVQSLSPDALTMNVLLFDPVPGDQVWSGFPWTGKNAKDVRRCAPLRRVLAIYPHEPLPWISFHAPVLVAYPPQGCLVEEDVWPGCHQGALFATGNSRDRYTAASNLSFLRILEFGETVGTRFSNLASSFGYQPSPEYCLGICRSLLNDASTTHRDLHDGARLGRAIVKRTRGQYLNKFHESLESRLNAEGRQAAQDTMWVPNTLQEEMELEGGSGLPRYMLGFEMDASTASRCSQCSR